MVNKYRNRDIVDLHTRVINRYCVNRRTCPIAKILPRLRWNFRRNTNTCFNPLHHLFLFYRPDWQLSIVPHLNRHRNWQHTEQRFYTLPKRSTAILRPPSFSRISLVGSLFMDDARIGWKVCEVCRGIGNYRWWLPDCIHAIDPSVRASMGRPVAIHMNKIERVDEEQEEFHLGVIFIEGH